MARSRGRNDHDPDRLVRPATLVGRDRGSVEQRTEERFIAGEELAPAMEGDRSSHLVDHRPRRSQSRLGDRLSCPVGRHGVPQQRIDPGRLRLPMTSTAQSPRARFTARPAAWLDRWGSIVPLLVAEFIVWLGFGALLPVLPLYFEEQGIDLATLGLVIAAWPAARLVGEPAFGWLADRTARVPIMVVGLVATGIFTALPLVVTGPLAFIVLRAAAGLSTAAYDPAARGFLTDATEPARRGEAFGLYGAAQMGGLLLGPAIGAFGAALVGGNGFVFVFCGVASLVAAAAIGLTIREAPLPSRTHPAPRRDHVELPHEGRGRVAGDDATRPTDGAPSSLWNRGLVAVLIINAGGYFASGTYEVIWSIFLRSLGAGLDLIGLTFAMFGLPILLLSPTAGRLVDRRGVLAFIVLGSIAPFVDRHRLHADHQSAASRSR